MLVPDLTQKGKILHGIFPFPSDGSLNAEVVRVEIGGILDDLVPKSGHCEPKSKLEAFHQPISRNALS